MSIGIACSALIFDYICRGGDNLNIFKFNQQFIWELEPLTYTFSLLTNICLFIQLYDGLYLWWLILISVNYVYYLIAVKFKNLYCCKHYKMFLTQTYKHLNKESIISSDIKQNIFLEYIEDIKDIQVKSIHSV